MIKIDGSIGEGGGQILRSALSLSVLTGQPFSLTRIRAGRPKPGLMRQHLTAVKAAAAISNAAVDGDELRSTHLVFSPEAARGGTYHFAVGTAGSCMLVLQTVLVPLLMAAEPSELVLEGGTHNPYAPTTDFIDRVFLPVLRRMGAEVTLEVEAYGFYPPGGGRVRVSIQPCPGLQSLELTDGGQVVRRQARVLLVQLPEQIARRELNVVRKKLNWAESELEIETCDRALSPGNVVNLEVERAEITELFLSIGERNVRSEKVAARAIEDAREYLAAGEAAVGKFLADQLLVPLAIGRGGVFTTLPATRHTTTNIATIQQFLDVAIETRDVGRKVLEIKVNV